MNHRMTQLIREKYMHGTAISTKRNIAHLFKAIAVTATITTAVCTAAPALGQTAYPIKSKVIRIVGPLAAGGPTDIVTRMVAEKMTTALGTTVVSEPRPGAGGQIAYETVARSAPDGYTLLMGTSGIPLLPLNYKEFKGDIFKDLVPITHFFTGSTVFLVGTHVPAKTMQEFVAYARANPGKMNYAGSGTADVYAAELLKLMAGFKAETIRYKGGAPGVTAIIAGESHYTFASSGQVKGFVDAGRARILATSGVKRSAVLPDLPTISETVAPGFNYLYWAVLFGPAGLPKPIADMLHAAASNAIRQPDVRQRLFELGYESAGGGPEDSAKLLADDYAMWKRMVQETGIKALD